MLSIRAFLALAVLVGLAACAPEPAAAPPSPPPAAPAPAPEASPVPPPEAAPAPEPAPPVRPAWLGTRVLPLRPDGFGEVRPTPPELRDRRLPPAQALPPSDFATIAEVPADVAARSTWSPECPVALEDLRYLTVPFWGFDDLPHTGELVVHASVAEDVAAVFTRLYDARFPLEQMRIVSRPELDLPPTGDGNNTSGFVCRPVTGGSGWSQHAYGLAVDVNPFHNPYARGDLVVPELASAYLDRDDQRPGMVTAEVRDAFAAIGWGWGGAWSSAKDYMHFSASGR